jgi:hypothetical protein
LQLLGNIACYRQPLYLTNAYTSVAVNASCETSFTGTESIKRAVESGAILSTVDPLGKQERLAELS